MPLKAKLFITAVVAIAAATLLLSLASEHDFPNSARFIQCLVLAVLAGTLKIRLPGTKNSMAPNFVILLVAMTELPFNETLVIATFSCFVQCVWRPRSRLKAVQVGFSLASTALATALGFALTASIAQTGALVPALVLGSALFFIVNSGLVSTVMALAGKQHVLTVWRNCHRWAFPYYLVGAALATAIVLSDRSYGWAPAAAMLPLVYMIHTCYEQWIRAQEQHAPA